jgi:hypothetical protein
VGITVLSSLCSRPPCGHLLELLAGLDALQHGWIVNLTGVDNKAFRDPETGSDRLLETRGLRKSECFIVFSERYTDAERAAKQRST